MSTNWYKKTNDPTVKMDKGFRQFMKIAVKMANKHILCFSTSSATTEMQNKTAVRYYFILIRMATIKISESSCLVYMRI